MALLPRVLLITTGGTIAGQIVDSQGTYQAAVLNGEMLLRAIPGIAKIATVRIVPLLQKDSADMQPPDWVKIAQSVEAGFADDTLSGIVITHGTDTLEETAYFLSHVLKPNKPVVMTAAMRPANALSPDGPQNLWDAIGLSAMGEKAPHAVMVVAGGWVHDGVRIEKRHATALSAITSEAPLGPVGQPLMPPLPVSFFVPLDRCGFLPPVAVLWVGAGTTPDLLHCCGPLGYAGIVLALPGDATLPKLWDAAIQKFRLAHPQVVLVLSSRTGSGARIRGLTHFGNEFNEYLPPAKARVALMLLLALN